MSEETRISSAFVINKVFKVANAVKNMFGANWVVIHVTENFPCRRYAFIIIMIITEDAKF